MQKIEFKRVLVASTPLVLVTLLVVVFSHSINTYIRCIGKAELCEPIATALNKILVPDDPTTFRPNPSESSEEQKKVNFIVKHERNAARYSGRITWLFLRSAYTVICIVAFVVACGVIYKSFADEGKLAVVLVLVATALSAGFGIYLLNNSDHFMSVFKPLFQMTIEKDFNYATNITQSMTRVNSFGFAVVLSAVLAVCAILYSPYDNSFTAGLKELSTKMKYLQLILYVGTIMLVVGVLLIQSVYKWALAYLSSETQSVTAAGGFFSSLLAAEGGVFTLILASAYLPAALILRRRADSLVGSPEQNADKENLLQGYGLTFSFTESLPKIFAILAPLLAGPVGDLFRHL